ncbi:hypothetical protein DN069_09865 [Streptacidiphilus pinicola]|uniref:PPE domain-containing protein n=1 Tax=Streptacidiphilus pinicola TaxID=2219663 RepID=A0A2X0IL14_9ACTN|nr:hypothetical protein DN069_09865 [Streptacidiphilus pinicola]
MPTVEALSAMIETADPAAVQGVADHWQHLHDELQETAAQLTIHAGNLLDHWNGPAADAFRRQTATLHTSLTNGAAHAANAATATGGVATALTRARADMPADPGLLGTVLRAVTSQTTDWQFKTDAARHGLAHALAADGAQLSAPEQARQQAVVVMERLGVAYNDATARLNHPPKPPTTAHTHGAWPSAPATAPGAVQAGLDGEGRLRAGTGAVGAGLPGAGLGPGATAAPTTTTGWVGAPPPEVSPTARASAPETRRTGSAETEPEPGAAAGEGLRPSGAPGGGSSRNRRTRTRYPFVANTDDWDAPPANPAVIEG